MISIEYLYPEVANLYGDKFNIIFLEKCLKESNVKYEIIETHLNDTPVFTKKDVDLVYMGSMSESNQLLVVSKLAKFRDIIEYKIRDGKNFLFTGNSFEVLLRYIEDDKGKKKDGLKLLNYSSRYDLKHRYNTLFLGTFHDDIDNKDIEVLGHKATFSFTYGNNKKESLFKSIKGCGINKESDIEGIRKNNLFATYLIGPFLVLNPDFTKYLMKKIGVKEPKIVFEEEAYKCFNQRLEEFKRPSTNYLQ